VALLEAPGRWLDARGRKRDARAGGEINSFNPCKRPSETEAAFHWAMMEAEFLGAWRLAGEFRFFDSAAGETPALQGFMEGGRKHYLPL